MQGSYPVITLCGSTRFRRAFEEVNKRLTLEGCIVISVGLYGHSGDSEVWENMDEGTLTRTKEMLDEMHKRKIDMADAIFVINEGGYIGDSTRSEVTYAAARGKEVYYLESPEEKRCPCCRKYYFREKNAYEICPVCGWEDDPLQRREEELEGGANRLSLREARKNWEGQHECQ
ncbi:MAG: hypothetical protein J6H18_00685 [Lachnospiraceae bacterium]|nr:hypothetical protein [Lachnospiraceae bacterium]